MDDNRLALTYNPSLVALDGHQLLELGVRQFTQLHKFDARPGEGLDVSFLPKQGTEGQHCAMLERSV